jgi:hypothetical protein
MGVSKKRWSPGRKGGGWADAIEELLETAIETIRDGAHYEGEDEGWASHIRKAPDSEIGWDTVMSERGRILALLEVADRLEIGLDRPARKTAELYVEPWE